MITSAESLSSDIFCTKFTASLNEFESVIEYTTAQQSTELRKLGVKCLSCKIKQWMQLERVEEEFATSTSGKNSSKLVELSSINKVSLV